MRRQTSFSDIEYASQKVITRKERFLSRMDELVPWDEWCALIEPFWNAECERTGDKSPVPTETMLRLYLLQRWYSLSDEAAEEVVLDSRAMSHFAGVDFLSESSVPDSGTLCRFRKVITDNGLDGRMDEFLKAILGRAGIKVRGGAIVDASLVDMPNRTKGA